MARIPIKTEIGGTARVPETPVWRPALPLTAVPPSDSELLTPIQEMGVSFRVPFLSPRWVSNRVQRVWAALWGKTSEGMRLLKTNPDGSLHTLGLDLTNARGVYLMDNFLGTVILNFDFGEIVDYVHIVAEDAIPSATFTNDVTKWNATAMMQYGFQLGTHSYAIISRVARCRYARVQDIPGESVGRCWACGVVLQK